MRGLPTLRRARAWRRCGRGRKTDPRRADAYAKSPDVPIPGGTGQTRFTCTTCIAGRMQLSGPPPPPSLLLPLPISLLYGGKGGGGVSQEWHRCDACAASTAAAASTASVVATAATRDTKLSQTQAGTGAFGGPAQTRLCAQPAAQPRGTTRGTRRGTTGRAPRSHHSRRASTSPREDTCRRGFMKCDRLTAVRAGGAVHRHAGAAFRPRAAARRPRAGCGSCRCRGAGSTG